MWLLPAGVLPGLLSVVAASMHVCKCCQGNPSLAGPIQTTYILAMLVVVIDSLFCALIALQMFIIVGAFRFLFCTLSVCSGVGTRFFVPFGVERTAKLRFVEGSVIGRVQHPTIHAMRLNACLAYISASC